ncbi:hypothetical protein GQR58_023837 [Nymphon striatum]|nr:hypothetical protein GQR58_023837 [Nymphon striatum]
MADTESQKSTLHNMHIYIPWFSYFDDAISSFSSEVKTPEHCVEFHGYNTKLCREQGHTLKPKTNIVYLHLIDMAPADPSTMMLAMLKAQKISQEINQDYVVFTCDQQLYRVALHVKWENPAELSNVYLRLGGMHLLMSYCGCIGTLMADTGIVDVLSAAFGGVLKMLTGKKYPQNVRALRMLVEELLRPIFDNNELETMSGLQQVLDDGHHTMHHSTGLFNGIWSEIAIETTFMRYGHSKSGIVGITLKPETLKTWAYSLHTCHGILDYLDEMRETYRSPCKTTHKEETAARIQGDEQDRKNLDEKLKLCIDPLDVDQPSDGLVNIVTGQIVTHSAVNVDMSLKLGKTQMELFERSWPNGFHDTICKKVTTMAFSRRHIKLGNAKVFDTETIYARAMVVQSSARDDFTPETLMSYELSPVPTSMFDENGTMRNVPVEIANGRVCMRVDMTTTQEESDTLIIQQVAHVTDSTVLVVADDTDIFILLLYFCHSGDISSKVLMVSPVQGRAVLDINAAVEVHKLIIPDLLAAHGLTECDTVASCYGIGKGVALKVMRSNEHKLNYLGNTDVDLTDVVEQATHFMIACYGQSGSSSFTEARTKLWSCKFGRSKVTAPKLCALPPTTEAFKENVARAHLQVAGYTSGYTHWTKIFPVWNQMNMTDIKDKLDRHDDEYRGAPKNGSSGDLSFAKYPEAQSLLLWTHCKGIGWRGVEDYRSRRMEKGWKRKKKTTMDG